MALDPVVILVLLLALSPQLQQAAVALPRQLFPTSSIHAQQATVDVVVVIVIGAKADQRHPDRRCGIGCGSCSVCITTNWSLSGGVKDTTLLAAVGAIAARSSVPTVRRGSSRSLHNGDRLAPAAACRSRCGQGWRRPLVPPQICQVAAEHNRSYGGERVRRARAWAVRKTGVQDFVLQIFRNQIMLHIVNSFRAIKK